MSVLKIETLGADVLRRRAADIEVVDDDLRALIRDMFETMYDAEGIGLAGPQVGVDRRVVVIDLREEGSTPLALVNPRIVEAAKETDRAEEGCLSIPGISGIVERPARVVVEALSESGEPVRLDADGLLGRCLQHEIDHLDGVLFLDRLSPLKRKSLLKRYRTLLEEEEEKKRKAAGSAAARG